MSALDDLFAQGRRPFILAPMAGFTNSVCRKIFREYGADAAVSEFVYSRAVLSGSGRVLEKLRLDASERPAGVQLFGSDPSEMADAALKVVEEIKAFGGEAMSNGGNVADFDQMVEMVAKAKEAWGGVFLTAKKKCGL